LRLVDSAVTLELVCIYVDVPPLAEYPLLLEIMTRLEVDETLVEARIECLEWTRRTTTVGYIP
jgi:hypothetical protein